MIYRFDYFKRYEEPQLILCQPTDKEIGIINNPIDLKLEINFNDISTLTYKIYNNDEELTEVGEIGGVEKDWIPSSSKPNIYRLHKERRQVHALGIGYFIIDSITETEDSTGTYKNVTCKSCESELNNIMAPGVALKEVNMYPLYNDIYADKINNYERFKYLNDITTSEVSDDDTGVYVSESCILFNILSYAPSWRLSDDCVNRFESDPKYRELASTLRNFNDEDSTIYSFLRDKIAEAYECVVLFNIEDRTIDIKTYDDVFAQSTMILSESNILDKCEVKTDINDYVNSLTVEGGSDNLFISDFTPDGTNVVYDFSHDLASGMIEGELAEALRYWENATSDLSAVTIEGATGLPLQVYPDSFEGYEGNDLYQFLYASKKAISDWIDGYNSAKANNIAYSEILPPDIAVYLAGETDEVNAVEAEYKFTVKKVFSSSDIIGFGWDTLYSNNNNALKTIIPYSANDSDLSDDAKLVAQASRIATQLNALGSTLPFRVIYNSGDNFFVLQQYFNRGRAVPYVEITNSDYNISGTLLFELKNPGAYACSSTTYSSFITDTTHDGGVAKIVTKGCGWIEEYRTQDVTWDISEANKVLSYLGQEREDAESCYNLLNGHVNALASQIEALEQEEQMSGISGYDFDTAISSNEPEEIRIHREEYSIAKQYKDLFEKFAQAFLGIRTQLDSWINTLKNKIYEATEGRKFQGAFKNFYTEEKGESDADEAQRKAVNLYNQLTRVLRMQSFKDDTIITTDEMKMYEIFDQEQALYNKATNTLAKLVQPNADITIDAEPFIFNEEYKGVTDNIDMGYCIYIELPNGEVPMYHLNQITIDYGAPSCQLTFGDRIRSSDPADIFGELQKTASTAANIVASERIDWGVKTSAINYLMKEKDADIATTFRAMANSVNNVKLDSEGLSCFTVNPSTGAEEYGFRGANGTLMFIEKDTEGNQVPKMAIGRIYRSDGSVEYGLYGDRILANTITAEKLAVGTVTTGSNYLRNGSFEGEGISSRVSFADIPYWDGEIVSAPSSNPWEITVGKEFTPNTAPGKFAIKVQNITGGDSDTTVAVRVRQVIQGTGSYLSAIQLSKNEYNFVEFETTGDLNKIAYWPKSSYANLGSGVTPVSFQDLSLQRNYGERYAPSFSIPNGSYCLKLASGKRASQKTDTLSADTYTLSYYYRLESSNSTLNVSAGGISASHTGSSAGTGAWHKNSLKITLSSNTTVTVTFSASGNTCYVDAAMLAKGSNEFGSGEYSPHVSEQYAKYTAIDQNGVRIYDGNLTLYDASGQKKIYTSGSNFFVKGRIEAEYLTATAGGVFSGWTFDSNTMYKDVVNNDVHTYSHGLSTLSTRPAIWIGESRTNTYPANGESGWRGKTANAAQFLVTQDGKLYANDAIIKGSITATTLKLVNGNNTETEIGAYISSQIPEIPDFDLKSWKITDTGLKQIDGNSYNLLLRGNPEKNDDAVIKAGDTSETYFQVNADGSVMCNSLTAGSISITADSNNNYAITTGLGDSWTIGEHTLYSNDGGSDSTNGAYIFDAGGELIIDKDGNLYSKGVLTAGWDGSYGLVMHGASLFFANGVSLGFNNNGRFNNSYFANIAPLDNYSGIAINTVRFISFAHNETHKITMNFTTNKTEFYPADNSTTNCFGSSGYRWSEIYADKIYVGQNSYFHIYGSHITLYHNGVEYILDRTS